MPLRHVLPNVDHQLDVVPADVVYSLEIESITAVMSSEEIVFANTTRVNMCHYAEFDDPFDELRAGCVNPYPSQDDIPSLPILPLPKTKKSVTGFGDCHVVGPVRQAQGMLLAMTKRRARCCHSLPCNL